jgi:hypothetical protein
MSPRACAGGASRGCSNPGSCSENGREGATRVDFYCVHRTSKKLATQTLPDARRDSRAERGDRLRVTNATTAIFRFLNQTPPHSDPHHHAADEQHGVRHGLPGVHRPDRRVSPRSPTHARARVHQGAPWPTPTPPPLGSAKPSFPFPRPAADARFRSLPRSASRPRRGRTRR